MGLLRGFKNFTVGAAKLIAPIGESIGSALGTFTAKDLEEERTKIQMEQYDLLLQQIRRTKSSQEREQLKKIAVRRFVVKMMKHVEKLQLRDIYKQVSIKMSDDDSKNLDKIKKVMSNELSKKYPDVKFSVYDTSDEKIPGGVKLVISK